MPENAETPTVVLLHGLCRTRRSLRRMETALRRAGYDTLNLDYPSRQAPIETIARQVRERIPAHRPLHCVTHSMGGIVLRQIQATQPLPQLRRAVMIAPPNRGSEIVDRLGSFHFFHWFNGPAGRQIGTDPESLPNRLGPVDFELGVIAGALRGRYLLGRLIPPPNDGKVAVERTRVEGMRDFRAIRASHSLIAQKRETIRLTLQFLREGQFN